MPPSNREAQLFEEALRLPEDQRDDYLAKRCATDLPLRRRVEELLQAQREVGDFMEAPGGALAEVTEVAEDALGSWIGRYQLLEKIGEGGCGVIYRAEQLEPVRRTVALKIIKPGMDTKGVIARFEAERQALALMNHPGIAKVFDAGETASRRPYFAMELIRGSKITDYCDRHCLSIEERLRIFVLVCQAVQHAHQNGIIHRDLKPANVLVTTLPEGEALPVVIDFGIAKASTGIPLTDKTCFTAYEMFVGTPAYMSPEQMARTSVPVDTRTDVYSLGVLLYELLTGTTPFDVADLLQAGLDEMYRAIREQEPARPSIRLSRLTAEALNAAALRRRTDSTSLIHTVRGDLDWIVMKTLEKDRARRYDTVGDLAQDVGRFLRDEMISARPASALYRLKKSAARNKLLFGSLTVIALLLVGSLISISASLADERRARAEADAARRQAEADRAQALADSTSNRQLTQFFNDLLRGVGPVAARGRDTTLLHEILGMTVGRVSRELADQPAIRAELQYAIATVYHEAQLWNSAAALYGEALDGFRAGKGPESIEVARTLRGLGSSLLRYGRFDAAVAAHRESLELCRRRFGSEHAEVATSQNELARALWHYGERTEAERMIRDTLVLRRRILAPDHPDITDSLATLGWLLSQRETDLVEAEALQREALERLIKANGPRGNFVETAGLALGRTLQRQAKLSAAATVLEESNRVGRAILGNTSPQVERILVVLGRTYAGQGRLAEAEAAYRETLASVGPLDPLRVLDSAAYDALDGLGQLLELRGDLTEAETLAREQLKMSRGWFGEQGPETAAAAGRLASVLVSGKRIAEADAVIVAAAPPSSLETSAAAPYLKVRANHHARLGRWTAAVADASRAAAQDPTDLDSAHLLTAALVAAGDHDRYRAHCQSASQRLPTSIPSPAASRLALDWLILESSGVSESTLEKLLETARLNPPEGNWQGPAEWTHALWEYRQGRYARAIEWTRQAAASPQRSVRTAALAIEAMAHHRRGEISSAHAALLRSTESQPADLPPSGDGDWGAGWKDSIHADIGTEWKSSAFARVLLEEASALLASDTRLARADSPTLTSTPP